MTFSQAVSDGFSKYVMFRGRSSRSAYWWWYLFSVLAVAIGGLIDVILGTWIFSGLVSLALLLPNLAVTVRRLHDGGHTGWWILIGLLPLIGFIVLLVFTLQRSDEPNQWGAGPDTATAGAA